MAEYMLQQAIKNPSFSNWAGPEGAASTKSSDGISAIQTAPSGRPYGFWYSMSGPLNIRRGRSSVG